ncbi:MAG: carbohydrate ABC transporter permease [Candidatus Manganitrophus sp. SB1]|nr:carbohydrate ABC transporter permease [Candidatus Manganitrophus morganii]
MMKRSLKQAGFFLLLFATALFFLGPVVWQAITSVTPDSELITLPPILPQHPTLEHYRSIFTGHPFFRIILNSLAVAGMTTFFSLAFGALAAFALARLHFKGKGLLLGMALGVSMFPPVAIVSPLYLIVRALGLRDTWWALVLTHTAFSLPLSLWILTRFFEEIPAELYRAAQIDGCTPLQAFTKVLLPLAAPGLSAVAILVFLFSWGEFLFALTFTTTEASRTIPVGIALFPGLHEIPYGDMAAASIVVTLPVILLVLFFQRRIVEGLTAGAVKG